MRKSTYLAVLCLAACGARSLDTVPPPDEDDPAARATHVAEAFDGYRSAFVLMWKGARIGEATERFFATDNAEGGFRFERTERVIVKRGDAISEARTRIRIDVDVRMSARRIVIDRRGGAGSIAATATRMSDNGWMIVYGDSPPRLIGGNAVPSTLVPLLVAAAGAVPGRAFSGPVLVEGSGLARAELTVTITEDKRYALASLQTASGALRARAELDFRGHVVAAGEDSGLASRRASPAELRQGFNPPEIVESSAIAVAGTRGRGHGFKLAISGVQAAPPELLQLPQQRVTVGNDGTWEIRVERTRVGSLDLRKIRERTAHVSRLLEDDLGAFALTPEEALNSGRGDCTGHSLVLWQKLDALGYKTRLVTGFLYDQGTLQRHRWVLVQLKNRWIPVDPMYNEAPASENHLALAIHGASPDDLAFVDDIAFSGWGEATAWFR